MDAMLLFQGRPLQLRALEVTWPALREGVDGALLSALARGEGAALGAAPPAPDGGEMHLPRTLEHPSALSLDVLTKVDPLTDHVVLSGFPRALLEQMSKGCPDESDGETSKHEGRHNEEEEQAETVDEDPENDIHRQQELRNEMGNNRWTVLSYEDNISPDNDENSYEDVCRKNSERNVHWLQCHGDGKEVNVDSLRVTWKRTEGSVSAVAPFVLPASDACTRAPTCVHVTDAVRDAAAWWAKTGLLVGEPGIGKTQFLQRLAAEAGERASGRWAVMVQALEHREFLKQLPDPEDLKLEHVVELLASAAGDAAPASNVGKASRRCLEAALFQSGAIDVILDGVDEVCPAFKDKLIRLLELLLETQVHLVWVSSRPQVEVRLRQALRCQTSSLRPFSKAEQKSYLCKYWASLYNCALTEFENLADTLVETLQETSQREQKRSLFDVPQHTQMAAEVIESYAAATLNAGINMPPNFNLGITLYELYRRFVDKKRNLYRERFGLNDANFENVPFIDKFDEIHQNCAMFVLISDGAFNGIDLSPFKTNIETYKDYLDKEKTGILWLREDGILHFAHYSFVEFFVASWMFSQANHPCDTAKTICLSFLIERDAKVQFLDQMLAEGHPLHEAVLEGDCEALKAALATRDLNEVDRFGRLALHLAASLGRVDAVDALIAKDPKRLSISQRDLLLGWTPLQYAAINLEVMESLLLAGADFSEMPLDKNVINGLLVLSVVLGLPTVVRSIFGSQTKEVASELCRLVIEEMILDNRLQCPTLFHVAARRGHYEVMEILLENGADVNAVNSMKETPLMFASRSGKASCLQLLLDHDADVHARCENGQTALHWAAEIGDHEVMNLLLDKGGNANAEDNLGTTPLILAVRSGRESCVRLLLEHEADVHAGDASKGSALFWAAKKGHLVILKLLVERGANVGAETDMKNTPLLVAVVSGNESCVQLLLQHKADVYARDVDKWTPLLAAALIGYHKILKLLVEHGADINAVNVFKETPLILAVKQIRESHVHSLHSFEGFVKDGNVETAMHCTGEGCHEQIMNFLLKKGAQVNALGSLNETPLIIAVKRGKVSTAQLLIQHGADVNAKDTNVGTALHWAAEGDRPQIVELLLENRANVNECNSSMETPLIIAVKRGNESIAQLLLQHGADVDAQDLNGKTALDWAAEGGNEQILNLLYQQILKQLGGLVETILRL